jgi:hypothetical protein
MFIPLQLAVDERLSRRLACELNHFSPYQREESDFAFIRRVMESSLRERRPEKLAWHRSANAARTTLSGGWSISRDHAHALEIGSYCVILEIEGFRAPGGMMKAQGVSIQTSAIRSRICHRRRRSREFVPTNSAGEEVSTLWL